MTEGKAQNPQLEAIAIIGIGCRFPGRANSAEQLWTLLREGKDATIEMPEARRALWPQGRPIIPERGGFLQEPIEQFDSAFFSLSPREAPFVDPQQRLLLEVSWEALEDAGLDARRLAGSQTGVFVGIYAHDYQQLLAQKLDAPGPYFGTGTSAATASGRLSYFYDFRGPALSVDTASSSSLVAVHLACRSLLDAECDLALAAGVNLILTPALGLSYTAAGMLAADGRSKGFDKDGDGYARGEGCGIVVLKRLEQALAEGDRVLAVIRGSAINQDGASAGLTVPSAAAQEAVLRKALAAAAIPAESVTYVEAHGSGTPVGDPVEGRAIAAVYGAARRAPLHVGSVKSNLGHLEAAAGIAGLIKAVLALRNRLIPAHLHLRVLHPELADLPLQIPLSATEWNVSHGQPRRAGVSSFGFGGTNAHVILEEAPSVMPVTAAAERPCQILTLSARDEAGLAQLAGRYADFLRAADGAVWADACFTSHVGRAGFEHNLAVVSDSAKEAQAQLDTWLSGGMSEAVKYAARPAQRPRLGFLFTGSGAQYPGMGRALYAHSTIFRAAIDRCDALLRPLWGRSLVEMIEARCPDPDCLAETRYLQPALFAVSYALTALWASWGIEADVVCGHSLGEYAAACAAGILTLEDAIVLVVKRSQLIETTAAGEMVALRAPQAQVQEALRAVDAPVALAVKNGPDNLVIAGDKAAIRRVIDRLPGVEATTLKLPQAYHSPLMDPILAEFEEAAQKVAYSPPQRRYVSSMLGRIDEELPRTPKYWRRHIRELVRFDEALQAMRNDGVDIFLELGPKPTLIGIGKESYRDVALFLPSLQPPFADYEIMLQSLAELTVRGFAVNWTGFERDYAAARQRIPLPSYPFSRQRYWLDDAAPVTVSATPQAPPAASAGTLPGEPVRGAVAASREAPTTITLSHVLAAPPQQQTELIARFLEQAARQILRLRAAQPVPIEQPLRELGLDSLMAAELRNTIRKTLGIAVAVERLTSSASLQSLVTLIGEKLESTHDAAPTAHLAGAAEESRRQSTELEDAAEHIPQLHALVEDQRQRQVLVDGRWYADFASVNYLGVDLLPEIMQAIPPAVDKWGIHPSWSRTFATMHIYEELEAEVTELMSAPATLAFPAVTLLHAGLLPLLVGYDGVIFKDIAAHRSIAEACRLAQADGAECIEFQNNDVADLEQKLARHPLSRTKLIAIDGIYSMSGLYPPLPAYAALAKRYNARIYQCCVIYQSRPVARLCAEGLAAECAWREARRARR